MFLELHLFLCCMLCLHVFLFEMKHVCSEVNLSKGAVVSSVEVMSQDVCSVFTRIMPFLSTLFYNKHFNRHRLVIILTLIQLHFLFFVLLKFSFIQHNASQVKFISRTV